MREVLFRGKRIDNDEWVYGSFCMDAVEQLNGLCGVDGFIRLYDKDKRKMQMYEVDRETVGQFTGLTDKNGKKIFEGDILQNEEGCLFGGSYRFRVEFSRGRFYGKSGELLTIIAGEMYLCEVIGNIHDNPELMEVEK